MRATVRSIALATQTAPCPDAIALTSRPTRNTAVIRFVAGSMRASRPSSRDVTQTAPSPAATCPGTNGSAIDATTPWDKGSILQIVRPNESPTAQTAPSPAASPSNVWYAVRKLV